MKKWALLLQLALLITGCAQQTFTVQNKPAAVATGEPSPIISSCFWNWAEEKLSMQPKFVAAQKMLKEQKTRKTFVNGLLGFITLGILYSLEARVLLTIIVMSCQRQATDRNVINILLPFQLFLHSDQPLLWRVK